MSTKLQSDSILWDMLKRIHLIDKLPRLLSLLSLSLKSQLLRQPNIKLPPTRWSINQISLQSGNTKIEMLINFSLTMITLEEPKFNLSLRFLSLEELLLLKKLEVNLSGQENSKKSLQPSSPSDRSVKMPQFWLINTTLQQPLESSSAEKETQTATPTTITYQTTNIVLSLVLAIDIHIYHLFRSSLYPLNTKSYSFQLLQ